MLTRTLLTTVAVLAFAGPAAAAGKDGAYKGRTDQNRAVTFTVKRGKVVAFQAGVMTFCTTFGANRFETDAIASLPAIPIKGNRFRLKKDVERDGTITIEVCGTITGSKVKGKVTLSRPDSSYDASQGTTRFGVCAANDRPYTATRS
jgi:hypothetical protein